MTFYLPKLVLIGSLWLLVVSLSCWQEFKQLRDPTYDYQFDTGYAMVCFHVSCSSTFYVMINAYAFICLCLHIKNIVEFVLY